jgi:hypothetical protein
MSGFDPNLERLHLNELPADAAAALRAAPGTAERLAALRESDGDVRARYPSLPRRRQASPARRGGLVLALAAAVALIVVTQSPPPVADPPGLEIATAKGEPVLELWRDDPDGPQVLSDGDPVAAGATLQARVAGAGLPVALLLSLDGRGVVTRHYAGPVKPGTQALPVAYTLDDAPEFERFLLVVGQESPDPAVVETALRRAGANGAIVLPSNLRWRTTTLRKESP